MDASLRCRGLEIWSIASILAFVCHLSNDCIPEIRAGAAPAPPKVRPGEARPQANVEPPYHVILLDDDEHTYAYVIEMLCTVFSHSLETAFRMAKEVDAKGKVIVATCHKELAELRKEQVETFGADPRVSECRGSMSAIIEPAA